MQLRLALNREGNTAVAIDAPLILPHTRLQDGTHRDRLMQALVGLQFDNPVLRLSGFGSNAMPLTVKWTIAAIEDLHGLSHPILFDHVGGSVGTSTVAFGIVSSIVHCVGERDRFSAWDWRKPPKKRKEGISFGRLLRVPLLGVDKAFA